MGYLTYPNKPKNASEFKKSLKRDTAHFEKYMDEK